MSVKKISKQDAIDRGLFGPVYHGTHETAREAITKEGFKVHVGSERSGDISHGYQASSYAEGKPAPVHHIGYGAYFTTVKAIAKSFNQGSLKGLKEYYLDIPKLETINFGAQGTMMKWWVKNGYDMPSVYPLKPDMSQRDVADLRVKATVNLTDNLKSKWDAVWFKGKGINRLLDGDQIVVFDPARIYEVDKSLSGEFEVGSKVRRKSDGMLGEITRVQSEDQVNKFRANIPGSATWLKPETKRLFDVKWKKGGTQHQVQDIDVEAAPTSLKKKVESMYHVVYVTAAALKYKVEQDEGKHYIRA